MLNNEDYPIIFHEIKNSITLIDSSLQLVAKKYPSVNDYDYWMETMSEIGFLKNMVTQLSSVGLCGRLKLEQVNMQTYMHEVTEAAHMISQNGFCCQLSVTEELPPVELDPQLMKQAIINLLKNAYEAMNETGTILIETYLSQELLHIKITDYGGGLDPALADTIFQPFITSKTGGSGLGLSITKKIIESHHGTLTCDSRLGDGCTFTITIPITQN